jgi:integrase
LPSKVSKVEHYKALPVTDMPEFMEKLAAEDWTGAKALHFGILTAARSGELREATWEEIDFDTKVWTVPADRMKGGRSHKVPLCDSAVTLLESMPRESDYLFANTKGRPLADATISKAPKRIGFDVTAHGFRSTFKDWAREHTSYTDEVSELALAHVGSDATRAAYARSELLDKRRDLMTDWERFCLKGLPKGKVVPMRKRRHV